MCLVSLAFLSGICYGYTSIFKIDWVILSLARKAKCHYLTDDLQSLSKCSVWCLDCCEFGEMTHKYYFKQL